MSIEFSSEIQNWPDFDTSHPRRRNARGKLDGFVHICSFDQDKPAQMLLRLCKRTIRDG